MAKRRQTDPEAAAALDQVLLGLFAGQLLLGRAEATVLPEDPAMRPAATRPSKGAKGKPRNRPPAAKPRKA